jgi:hypothetical protein
MLHTVWLLAASSLVLASAGSALAQAVPSGMTTAPPVAPSSPPSSDPKVEVLRRELEAERARAQREQAELARSLAELKAKFDSESRLREELAAASSEQRQLLERVGRGPVVRAGRLGLSLSGFVQVDAVAWRQSSVDEVDPSTGDPLNETRFLLRRARLRADLDYRYLFGSFEIDANTVRGPQVRPISFEVGVRFRKDERSMPYIAASMGLFRTPFGFEVQQSDRARLFLERSAVIAAFFPGEYDLGARIFGGWRFLRYAVAAMNGDPIGEKTFPGRDPNRSKDFVGRVGVDLDASRRFTLSGGFSAIYGQGFHPGVAAGKDTIVWRDANLNGVIDTNELQAIVGQVAQPSSNFRRYAIGGDLQLGAAIPTLGQLTLYGELISGVNMDRGLVPADPVGAARDLRELGFYVGVTQELTQYAVVGVRYDTYNPDRDATRTSNGQVILRDPSFSTVAVAAAARLPGYGRLIAEYDHNQNANGRNANGSPTTLLNDAFTIRAEATF